MKKEELPKEYQERIDRFNRLFIKGTKNTDSPHNFEEDDLFEYEMYCIAESLKMVNFLKGLENYKEKINTLSELSELMKESEYKLDEGHTGNSIGSSFMLARVYMEKPEILPYLHGSLAALVGDEGYHDDRSDIPPFND